MSRRHARAKRVRRDIPSTPQKLEVLRQFEPELPGLLSFNAIKVCCFLGIPLQVVELEVAGCRVIDELPPAVPNALDVWLIRRGIRPFNATSLGKGEPISVLVAVDDGEE